MNALKLLLLLSLAAASVMSVTGQLSIADCPFLCECSNNTLNGFVDVYCKDQVNLPSGIPGNTRNLRFESSSIDIIAINTFLGFKHLHMVLFANVTIATIRACSFAELGNLTAIVFRNCQIRLIEGNAFSNLFSISRIEFNNSRIDEIRSYAFQNLSNIDEIRFYKTDILKIQPFAFRMISHVQHISIVDSNITTLLKSGFIFIDHVKNVTIVGSHFEEVHCDNIDFLLENVTFPLVRNNTFNCTCFLTWLWTSTGNRTSIMRTKYELGNTCVDKGNLANVSIGDVCPNESQRNKGCAHLLPSPPHFCSSHYDDNLKPVTRLPYPTSFQPTPTSSASGLRFAMACLVVAFGVLMVNTAQWTCCAL